MENLILESYSQRAQLAHYWTSFSPEKRGEQLIKDYSGQLEDDIKELEAAKIDAAVIDEYIERYKRLFSSWLNAKSRCFSVMITGGSNFPVRRHEKANRSEENHYTIWQEWRGRAKKAIIRKAQPEKTFLSEIQRYKNELASLVANHEKMKQGNKAIAKAVKEGADISEYLMKEFDVKPHMVEWMMKFGFGLANSSANIRRVQDRIKLLEAKEQRAENYEDKNISFEGGNILYNYSADRIQIRHDVKPPYETIGKLKKHGFRWSPSFMSWQRQLNNDGVRAAEIVLNITLPSYK